MIKGYTLRTEEEARKLFDERIIPRDNLNFVWDLVNNRKENYYVLKQENGRFVIYNKDDKIVIGLNFKTFDCYFKKDREIKIFEDE